MTAGNPITSDWPFAAYIEQVDPECRGNPYIEALPPILDDDGAIRAMERGIRVTEAERELPSIHRIHLLSRIDNFMQPLDYHISLFHRISVGLRRGYVARNPTGPDFFRDLTDTTSELTRRSATTAQPFRGRIKAGTRQRIGVGTSLTLIGTSGVGKTTAVEAVLKCYDQVICHNAIEGQRAAVYQIVWLKLSIPHDGSIKALCIDFLQAIDDLLDTGYVRQYVNSRHTLDKLIIVIARVAFLHGLGLLVIDELQNLNVAKSGGADRMMNTFKLLRDVVKVPLLTIGTPEAVAILSGDLQVARRNSGLEHMERMKNDAEFRLFCESLFDAQFLRHPLKLTQAIVALLFWLSQGIADVVVKVFVGAQMDALSHGLETMEPAMFQAAYDRDLRLLHPFLEGLRRGEGIKGREFDKAIAETRANTRSSGGEKAADTGSPPSPEVIPISGVKARRRRRKKGEPSACLLVQVVEDAGVQQIGPHQALLKAGFIRQLGAEALEQ